MVHRNLTKHFLKDWPEGTDIVWRKRAGTNLGSNEVEYNKRALVTNILAGRQY